MSGRAKVWASFGAVLACGIILLAIAMPAVAVIADERPRRIEAAKQASVRLLEQIDLRRPEMVAVRVAVEAGDRTAAIKAWRATVIDRLRRAELGEFDYHIMHLRDRKPLADMLVGAIGEREYLATAGPRDFRDLYGFSGPPERPTAIDWLAVADDPVAAADSAYGTFTFAIPLAAQYWKTKDPVYLQKWMSIVAAFAQQQRATMDQLPEASRPRGNSSWIVAGDTCILQSEKVLAIIRSLAILCKALPSREDAGPREWSRSLAPVSTTPLESAVALLDPDQLAAIVLSLTSDDPPLLLELYEATRAPPNQRCLGLTALLMIASQFPEVTGMAELSERAGAALHEHVLKSFHHDGGMLEQSLNYNIGDAEKLRQIGRMFRGQRRPAWLADLATRLALYDRLIASLRTPAGELPVIGNNASNPPAIWRSEAIRAKWFDDRARAAPRLDVARLNFSSIAFPYSGYYVQRGSWDWESGYLFFMNARPSAGHCTMDNLAIELHALGRPLLVRGGPPHYAMRFLPEALRADADAIVKYMGEWSSYKVNTILVDGLSQVRDARPATATHEEPISGLWHASSAFDFVEGLYDLGYGDRDKPTKYIKGIAHHRQVVHFRGLGCWVVVDSMQSQGAASRAYTQIWKFPPYLDPKNGGGPGVCGFTRDQIVIDADGFHTADPAGPNLWALQSASQQLTREIHFGESNPYLGWYARQLGDMVPTADVHVCFGGAGDMAVVTLLAPTAGDATPLMLRRPDVAATEPAIVVLEAIHRESTTITVAVAPHGPATLKAGPVTARASLLVVQAAEKGVRGLALGCSALVTGGEAVSLATADFEFEDRDGELKVLAPIERPRGFAWIDSPRGSYPSYVK